jgi:molybdenum cofactor cytidylyltransferase
VEIAFADIVSGRKSNICEHNGAAVETTVVDGLVVASQTSGTIHPMNIRQQMASIIATELVAGRSIVLGYLAATSGSTYQKAGARMVFLRDGTWCGMLSGGCLEADLAEHAAECFEDSGFPKDSKDSQDSEDSKGIVQNISGKIVTYDTNDDGDVVFGTGMGCKGSMTVALILVKPVHPFEPNLIESCIDAFVDKHNLGSKPKVDQQAARRLLIFGAGADARPLCRLASDLDWQVTIVDPRPVFARHSDFPDAVSVVCETVDSLLILDIIASSNAWTAVVIMTHNFERDLVILNAVAEQNVDYLGILGPALRTSDLMVRLPVAAQEFLAPKLHSPIGLDLGGYGPESVAISIVAQIQIQWSGASGGSRLFSLPGKDIDTIILAAGSSSRMGQSKQLLKIEGESLVRRAVRVAIAAGQKNIFVVVGANGDHVREKIEDLPITIVENPNYASGMASSIAAGIRCLSQKSPGALIMTCDQPVIKAQHFLNMINIFNTRRPRICATGYEDFSGVPAIFSSNLYPELLKLNGDRGARAVVEKYKQHLISLPCPDAALDCDTPQEFDEMTNYFSQKDTAQVCK